MPTNKIEAIAFIENTIHVSRDDAIKIVEKAETGREFESESEISDWLENRFLPNIVYIDETGYARMCIDALKIVGTTAPTDYGSSRQRDFGQLWGDMTRGYLAEYAVVKYLEQNWNIKTELGHEQGELTEYLPTDIHRVKKENEEWRIPRIRIGIKGTKWNGIWFDIPNSQFIHSDIHFLVKVGTSRDHLFAYFKHISVFKDKVLKKGVEVGSLSQEQADSLYNDLPLFQNIPAYIAGFAVQGENYNDLDYSGKKGRINYTIQSWKGQIHPGDLERIRARESLSQNAKIKFEGIGDFAHDSGYLFNTGNLLWTREDWQNKVIDVL